MFDSLPHWLGAQAEEVLSEWAQELLSRMLDNLYFENCTENEIKINSNN